MAVRFLPPPEEQPKPQREDRGDLAEVIEFRSRLRRPEVASTAPAAEAPAAEAPAAGAPAAEASRVSASELAAAVTPATADQATADQAAADQAASDQAAGDQGASHAEAPPSWATPTPRSGAGARTPAGTDTGSAPAGTARTDAEANPAEAKPAGKKSAEAKPATWARLIEAPFGRDSRNAPPAGSGGPSAASPASSAGGASPVAGPTRAMPAAEPGGAGMRGVLSVLDTGGSLESADVPPQAGPTPYESAVKLLARRALSSGELLRALVALGHPELDAQDAVATCEESLYLDDGDLARSVATKLRESKGESKARIRQKLRERHLPDAAIEGALEGLDDEAEHELLRQTAIDRARRMAGLDRQTAERRLLGFLARRGWSGERASKAAREALDGAGRGDGGGGVRFR